MIKIYLDHNVFQALKKQEYAPLLAKVLESKKYVVYCFSEAHLYDLDQDRTNQKFEDMRFIETIAESNCYSFSDHTRFSYRSPTEYYKDFDWPATQEDDGLQADIQQTIGELFRQIPLPLKEIIQTEELPVDMPENMKRLLIRPSTMYDFMNEMMNMTKELKEQPHFRDHLRFLHQNSQLKGLYQSMGIEGYDGLAVNDKKKFWQSFSRKFIPEGTEKSSYDLYMEMYNGLDIFGIVKGKPKKQQMMSLLNDGRHAWFGKFRDIILSNDSDFINKASFMYDLEDVMTSIIPFKDFDNLLERLKQESANQAGELLTEVLSEKSSYPTLFLNESETVGDEYARLSQRYFLYFNLMVYRKDEFGVMHMVVKEMVNFESGASASQIRYIVERLINAWGPDMDGKRLIEDDELRNNVTLRTWRINELFISVIMNDMLYMSFYPIAYVQAQQTASQRIEDGQPF